MASREFAEAAARVVDAEFKLVTRARLDEIVDEIFRKRLLKALTFCWLPKGAAKPGSPAT